ncbi:signal peptidase I [Haloparvum sedimenti]|uniref:signal peptidase I n=1 Tax=Haloparvum sedimenti TaxID=1678448 RepID=UPI00071E85E4|nr:signal peptidase I [Haloparvum sedimenti]
MNTRKLASVAALLLLIAVVVPFVVYAAPWTIGADESYVVLTASMTPAIAPGDVVIVDDRGPEAITEGDVITFRRGDEQVPVTHRVVGVEERNGDRAFATKGDANEDADSGLVPASNVLGTVVLTIPYLGYVIQFGNSPYGFLALVVVPFGLLVITEIWSLVGPRIRAGSSDDTASATENSADAADGDPAATPNGEPAEPAVADSSVAESTAAVDPAVGGSTGATAVESDTGSESAGESGGEISVETIKGAAAVLALAAPYAVYVAVRLQSPVTLSVAFAATVTLLGAAGILLTARRATPAVDQSTTSDAATESAAATPASDGGTPLSASGDESEPADATADSASDSADDTPHDSTGAEGVDR